MGVLGVHIGLNSVNVTLKAMPIYNQSSDIDYNERFHWIGATQMKEDYRAALEKGLPFPILTVGEYFTVDAEDSAGAGTTERPDITLLSFFGWHLLSGSCPTSCWLLSLATELTWSLLQGSLCSSATFSTSSCFQTGLFRSDLNSRSSPFPLVGVSG